MKYEAIQHEWENIQNLKPKDKFKRLKNLCYAIELDEISELDHIKFIEALLKKSIKTLGYPGQLKTKLTELNVVRLRLMGIDPSTVNITLNKVISLTVDTGSIGIGDSANIGSDYVDKEIEMMESGKRFFFSTGADGIYKVQVRVVDVAEPVLTLKEYKKVSSSTDPFMIKVHTKSLGVFDGLSDCGKQLEIEPDMYKGVVFLLEDRGSFTYCICLARTNQDPPFMSPRTGIELLEPN